MRIRPSAERRRTFVLGQILTPPSFFAVVTREFSPDVSHLAIAGVEELLALGPGFDELTHRFAFQRFSDGQHADVSLRCVHEDSAWQTR